MSPDIVESIERSGKRQGIATKNEGMQIHSADRDSIGSVPGLRVYSFTSAGLGTKESWPL
jgi:hypothetical protein